MTNPAEKILIINQRANLETLLIWKDSLGVAKDLTGYTAEMDIRTDVENAVTLIELSTTNGRIVLNTNPGEILLKLTAADTGAITWTDAVYDLFLTDGLGVVTRLLFGVVKVNQAVTR